MQQSEYCLLRVPGLLGADPQARRSKNGPGTAETGEGNRAPNIRSALTNRRSDLDHAETPARIHSRLQAAKTTARPEPLAPRRDIHLTLAAK